MPIHHVVRGAVLRPHAQGIASVVRRPPSPTSRRPSPSTARGGGPALSSICAGITRTGVRCTQSVKPGETFCWNHAPDRAEARRRAASRAGSSKPNREIRVVKDRLLNLADDVLAGEVDRADGSSAAQILNTYLRAVEVERRTSDLSALMERLEALETTADRIRGA